MKNYVRDGQTVTITADTVIKSGDLVVVGAIAGVANADAAVDETVVLVTEGVFWLPVPGAPAVGDVVFHEGTALTTAPSDVDALRVGVVYQTDGADGTVAVKLKG